MDWFTADLHIGHDKDFIWAVRGFNNIYDHDTAIIKNWNKVVQPEDNVYILGDLCLGQNESEWDRIFYNLNGCKNFIYGNHDTVKRITLYKDHYNMIDLGYANIYIHSKRYHFYLSHYPTYTANYDDNKKYPLYNLYGHTHQKNNFYNGNKYMYHVGVDSHNMTPVSIEQIIKDIKGV